DILDTEIPYPTGLLVGGLVLGLLLAFVFRQLTAVGARRRATAVRRRAEEAVAQVGRELVIDPVETELGVRQQLRRLLTTAAGGGP
ncbi:MAG: ABC transporter, partial [Acidimicrobiia bacterium]|nr:ABC transporter [Acidimicrobiia bacterium]